MSILNNISMQVKSIICFIAVFAVLSGCADTQVEPKSGVIGNPTPEDYLDNSDADIFLLNEIVYSLVEDVDWVKELVQNR